MLGSTNRVLQLAEKATGNCHEESSNSVMPICHAHDPMGSVELVVVEPIPLGVENIALAI